MQTLMAVKPPNLTEKFPEIALLCGDVEYQIPLFCAKVKAICRNGLALHPYYPFERRDLAVGYVITHIKTGKRVCLFRYRKTAIDCLNELREYIDWDTETFSTYAQHEIRFKVDCYRLRDAELEQEEEENEYD